MSDNREFKVSLTSREVNLITFSLYKFSEWSKHNASVAGQNGVPGLAPHLSEQFLKDAREADSLRLRILSSVPSRPAKTK